MRIILQKSKEMFYNYDIFMIKKGNKQKTEKNNKKLKGNIKRSK